MSHKYFFHTFFFLLMGLQAAAFRVDTLDVYSASMRKDVLNLVIVPDAAGKDSTQFPVLYLLHGYSGNYMSWMILDPDLGKKADQWGMIIVCPDGGYRSWYLDSPIDSSFRYETYMVNELLPKVDAAYPTISKREGRAITGLSMGGHGGLYLGIRHTEVFGAAGSSSGGVDIRQYTNSWDLKERILGDTLCCRQNWEDHTVINLVDKLVDGNLQLIIDCGVDDFFIGVNRNLHQKLIALKIEHDYSERPGKHDSAYWLESIDYHLLFFSKFFKSSTP